MDSLEMHIEVSMDHAHWGSWTENAKDTLCRNVTIYGRCRYEDKGNRVLQYWLHGTESDSMFFDKVALSIMTL